MARSGSCRSRRSTGSERGRWVPTPSDGGGTPARSRGASGGPLDELRAFDARLGERLQAGEPGTALSAQRAATMDRIVASLFEPVAAQGVALAAIGGYGGRDLTPGSDVDLLLVHEPEREGEARHAVEAVLYPLWDAGIRVSHAVRTPEGCREEAEARFDSLTSMLGVRLLGGSEGLVAGANSAVVAVVRSDPRAFVDRLRETRDERRARAGPLAERLEPDLKEGLGGVRDWQLARWLALGLYGFVTRPDGVAYAHELAEAAERAGADPGPVLDAVAHLLSVRLALHVVNGGTSNRLGAEHHDAVAGVVVPPERAGWEPRDALMGEVAAAGRTVNGFVGTLLDRLSASTAATGTPAATGMPARNGTSGVAGTPLRTFAAGRPLARWMAAVEQLPEWDAVLGRPQRDPYHRYPVDVHLRRAAAEADHLLQVRDERFAVEAARSVRDPDALILGALLHDIGKVGLGSHVAIGVEAAGRALDRLGVEGDRRDDVLFLVREHLLLSDTATRRNIGDEDLILHVAARIHDPERLAMLYLLTVADAQATGPSACTPWRMTLIRELVAKVARTFDRGLMDAGRAERFERAESALGDALLRAGRDPRQVQAFLGSVPAAYVQWASPRSAATDFDLVVPLPGPDEVRTHVGAGPSPGTYLLTVGARDRLGLLSAIAGSLSLAGLSILSTRVFTTSGGAALDVFDVRGAFEDTVDDERWDRFRAELTEALGAGPGTLEERVHALRAHYRPPPRGIPVAVHVDDDASDYFTLVEVEAPDRLGLLFDLTRTFARLEVDVHLAKVATYGPRVIDAFYVTATDGQKLTHPSRAGELERALVEAASAR